MRNFLSWFKNGVQNKTSWDWMDLIIAPLLIAFIVGIIEISNSYRERRLASRINNSQENLSKQIKYQDTLEKYLEKMTDLMVEHQLLKTNKPEILSVAQGWTFTALTGLDSPSKKFVLRFLYESKLIGYPNVEKKCTTRIIKLNRADLKNIDIADLGWQCVNLQGADLRNADLNDTNLDNSDLSYADLSNANLNNATIDKAFLCETIMPDGKKSKRDCK